MGLTSAEIKSIFELVFIIQQKITEKFAQGCDVRQHYRPFLKQGRVKVDHVHYHVIPRDPEDLIHQQVETHEADLFQNLPDQERNRMATLLE